MQENGLSELKALYRNLGYVTAFAHLRLSHAPYPLVEGQLPRIGRILDLGCGYGLFANYLALRAPQRSITGLDLSPRKLAYANRGLPNVQFIAGDVLQAPLEPCDAIVMNHLLHHLSSYDAQAVILKRCREILKPGGRVVICEIDRRPRWKFLVTQVVDHLLYLGDRIYYRDAEGFHRLFHETGFLVEHVMAAHQGVPMSHVVFVLTKSHVGAGA